MKLVEVLLNAIDDSGYSLLSQTAEMRSYTATHLVVRAAGQEVKGGLGFNTTGRP